jgi:hypothetical protein
MVSVKFTARPQTSVVSPKFSSMTLDYAPEVSVEQRETSAERSEDSLVDQHTVASMHISLSHEFASDHDSQSGDFEESGSGSDTASCLKVAATASLAGVTCDFGQSTMTKAHLASLGSNGHSFPKGYGRPPGVEFVPDPQLDEAIMFEDLFPAGLCMPPHLVLLDILHKF